jgi:hypothetical protein
MGASGWHYVVPYNEDSEATLQQLRNDVFASGRYGDPFAAGDVWTHFWKLPTALKLLVLAAKFFYATAAVVRWISRGFRGPRSIEEAVELAAESGTHSILDVDRCSWTPDVGVAAPLSPARMRRLFGADKATTDELEHVISTVGESIERGHCIYFPLYENDQPVKLVFVGCSGD